MLAEAQNVFGALENWQAMLDLHDEVFSGMQEGSSVAILPRTGSGILPGKHVGGLMAASGSGAMLVWQMTMAGMEARIQPYRGFQDSEVDLLFVAEDGALDSVRASLEGNDTLSVMKRLLRQGGIMFYVMRTKYELQDAGYEDFLDSLGLAFLGACR